MLSITKRGVVKFATRCIVYSATTQAITTVMTDSFDPQTDSAKQNIALGAQASGFATQMIVGPYTDKMIDRVANRHFVRKMQNQNIVK